MCIMHTGNKHVSSDPFMRFNVSVYHINSIFHQSGKIVWLMVDARLSLSFSPKNEKPFYVVDLWL